MASPRMTAPSGIPPGLVDAVLQILSRQSSPLRRRLLLEALLQDGHRISLAGLNRALQFCSEQGLTVEAPDGGVRLRSPPRTG